MSQLLIDCNGGIATFTFNRPEKRNAITIALWQEFDQRLRELGQRTDIRLLVIRGAGQSFCGGADLSAFTELKNSYGSDWMQKGRLVAYDMQAVLNRLQRFEVPSIAVIQRHCLGMGLELALACDLRICADDAVFGLPETLLGLVPDVGGTTRLTKLIGAPRAKELIFTGKQINAQRAEDFGLVHAVYPLAELDAGLATWTAALSKASPAAVGMAKRIIDSVDDLSRGLDLEGWAQTQLYSGPEFQAALQSFAKR